MFQQGRLPIRVELKGLTAADFQRILTEPECNMIYQQQVDLDGQLANHIRSYQISSDDFLEFNVIFQQQVQLDSQPPPQDQQPLFK